MEIGDIVTRLENTAKIIKFIESNQIELLTPYGDHLIMRNDKAWLPVIVNSKELEQIYFPGV